MFPTDGFTTGTPLRFFLPSTGSLWVQLPLLQRYYEGAMTSRRSSLRTSLLSLGGSSVALVSFAPKRTSAARLGLGLLTRWPPGIYRANGGISHVPEQSQCTYALLYDPGRTSSSGYRDDSARPPVDSNPKAPSKFVSRLNHTASVLAVYASQDRLPHHHARLASGCRPGSAGWDWRPTGLQ